VRGPALLAGAPLALLVAAVACDEATKPPFLPEGSPSGAAEATPTAPATPTATAVPESGGMTGFRAFGRQIEAALAGGDASFFSDRGVEEEMICAGDEQLGPCVEQPAGTVLRGIPGTAWKSDAFGVTPSAEYATMLSEWLADARPDQSDDYGSGAVKLWSLAQAHSDSQTESLAIATLIRETGPATGIQRQARIFRFAFTDGKWLLLSETLAAVSFSANDWLTGHCEQCYDQWERWEGTP